MGPWVSTGVRDEWEGPDGWHIIEFSFKPVGTDDNKLRGHMFTARVYYKNCGPNDPYGHDGRTWESTILGERSYPWL